MQQGTWYASNFFDIVEPRISRYWVSSIKEDVKTTIRLFFSFPKWANEELFYHNLIEGQRREMGLFARYRQLMDLEFPDPAVTQFAQVGDNSWLICPFCIDAWETPDFKDALVICPKCHETFCNPRYKNVFPSVS